MLQISTKNSDQSTPGNDHWWELKLIGELLDGNKETKAKMSPFGFTWFSQIASNLRKLSSWNFRILYTRNSRVYNWISWTAKNCTPWKFGHIRCFICHPCFFLIFIVIFLNSYFAGIYIQAIECLDHLLAVGITNKWWIVGALVCVAAVMAGLVLPGGIAGGSYPSTQVPSSAVSSLSRPLPQLTGIPCLL